MGDSFEEGRGEIQAYSTFNAGNGGRTDIHSSAQQRSNLGRGRLSCLVFNFLRQEGDDQVGHAGNEKVERTTV